MKRDMDLIRKIMLTLEEDGDIYFKEYEKDVIEHHVYLLGEAGLLSTTTVTIEDSKHQLSVVADKSPITWDGHAFIGAIRDEKLWSKVKKSLGGMTLTHFKTLISTKAVEGFNAIGDLFKDM